jgi:nucleotide sugar dehydrogenase
MAAPLSTVPTNDPDAFGNEPERFSTDAERFTQPPLLVSVETIADDAPADPAFEFDVAIVGLGYVGLPTALAFHSAGARVAGLDVSPARLQVIRDGRPDLMPDDTERLRDALLDPDFTVTADVAVLSRAAAVIICVPTPLDDHLVPALGILQSACDSVVAATTPGQVIVLTSTTYVGCTDTMLVEPLARRGLTAGRDVFVAFSPERIDPGNDRGPHEDVPRVVGGVTPECGRRAAAVLHTYAKQVHLVDGPGTAEMTKLLENTFRAVNIALANEFADIARQLGIDVMGVIQAAATKPYGFMPFYPGPGVGGHCIPCDPQYLLWQLRRERIASPVIEQAMSGIALRPRRVVQRVRDALSEHGRGLAGARVLVVGVAYKPNVEDMRESPALEILADLKRAGAIPSYLDPYFATVTLEDGSVLTGVDDPAAFTPDLVLVHTRHARQDLRWLADHPLVLDATFRLTELPDRVTL